jgi:hypothetical protein
MRYESHSGIQGVWILSLLIGIRYVDAAAGPLRVFYISIRCVSGLIFNGKEPTLLMMVAWVTTLLASSLIANAAQPASAEAELDPINNSSIHARTVFLDVGSPDNVLVIKGTATVLDTSEGQVYFSLVYNIGSVDEGPTACIPVPPPAPQITFNQMTTAF